MSQQFQINDGSLSFDVTGAGLPLVFIHAGFVDRRMWETQVAAFSKQYQVIRYDMRGFGESSPATGPIDRRAELRHLLDQLDLERVILVGCSMGGEIALDVALEQPDRVAALVLVASVPGGFEFQGEPPADMLQLFEALQANDIERAVALQNQLWISGPHRQRADVDPSIWQKSAEMGRIPVTNQTMLTADMQPLDPLDPPSITRLHTVSCPTLVIAGSLDDAELLRGNVLLAEQIPHAQRIIMQGVAHLPNMEQPDAFNQTVLGFLDDAVQTISK